MEPQMKDFVEQGNLDLDDLLANTALALKPVVKADFFLRHRPP
jgi:hypothetical protein